jgi:V/A-type H+/Na+-transporting ATPase subunit E
MEQHGLEQVIGELKARGIKAGEEEALRIIGEAKIKADKIIALAKDEADAIHKKSQSDKKATVAAMEAELRQAAKVGLAAFRQSIEKGFLVPEIDQALRTTLQKPNFFDDVIADLVKGFAASGFSKDDIEVILPETRKQELSQVVMAKLNEHGAAGSKVKFDDSLSFGFKIGSKSSGFVFDLTDEGFREIFTRFLSPRFRTAFYAGTNGDKVRGKA